MDRESESRAAWIQIENAVTDGPDFPADQEVAFLAFNNGQFARAACKATLRNIDGQVSIGETQGEKVRGRGPSSTTRRYVFDVSQVVPRSDLRPLDIQHQDEFRPHRSE
jgi:hypothetical protein